MILPTLADLYELALGPLGTPSGIERLAVALAETGPVVHRGWILEVTRNGRLRMNRLEALRLFATYEGADGHPRHDAWRIPPDEVLAQLWGMPPASAVEAPASAFIHRFPGR